MKKFIGVFTLALLFYSLTNAQNQSSSNPKKQKKGLGIGIKAGYNWSYATADQLGVTLNSKSGYMVGAFMSRGKGIIGYRTEIIYARQGYNYDDGGKNTNVMNDYIWLPQLTTISIGKFFQLQFGAQLGLLVNAKKNSAGADSSITGIMNRIDYGFAGGIELNPVKGLIIGGRYNLGLGKMYKSYQPDSQSGVGQPHIPYPLPFNPETTNFKNGVIQIFVGYKF
jgi:hypothetical protein